MEFRTVFSIKPQEPKIDYASGLFLIGSCFSENIGEKLDYYKLKNYRNPFGILYHPAAIEQFIKKVAGSYQYNGEEVFFHNERWHSFDAHSVMSSSSREALVEDLNKNLDYTRGFLKKASHAIITLGTSYGYRLEETGSYVGNCHKLPQRRFSKELMSVEAVSLSLKNIAASMKELNPDLSIVFTISPVRHIKDGVIENQLSKAHLTAAVHKVLNDFPNQVHYFPAYEIMMDELRDYRFYAEDMIHPNVTAIEYIWKKFREVWFSAKAGPVMEEVAAIQKGLQHRPFNAQAEAHQQFLEKLYMRIQKLENQYEHLKFN